MPFCVLIHEYAKCLKDKKIKKVKISFYYIGERNEKQTFKKAHGGFSRSA